MATELKVRHALVTYRPAGAKEGVSEKAFRTAIINVDEDEATRLRALGAVIEPDEDIPRPGKLMELPEAATDGEVVNWVLAASPAEIADLVAHRPEMAGRIEDAVGAVGATHDAQMEALKAAAKTTRRVVKDQKAAVERAAQAANDAADAAEARRLAANDPGRTRTEVTSTPPVDPTTAPSVPGVTQETIPPLDTTDLQAFADVADTVVAGTVEQVDDYLADNTAMGQAILDAEVRRATAEGKAPRKGVLESASTAIAMTTGDNDDDDASDDDAEQTGGTGTEQTPGS